MSIQFNPKASDWSKAFGDPSPYFKEEPSAPPAQKEVVIATEPVSKEISDWVAAFGPS